MIQEHVLWRDFNDDTLRFYASLGVDRINLDLRSMEEGTPGPRFRAGQDMSSFLAEACERVATYDMVLWSVFMSAWDDITYGTDQREAALDAWCTMLTAVGGSGIEALGYNFKPKGNFRTPSDSGRGDVAYSTFDYDHFLTTRKEPTAGESWHEDRMWDNMSTFLKRVIPVARDAGVRMALHPDDPPIAEPLGGVAQICSTVSQFDRILDEVDDPANGLLFCQGCFTELLGQGVYEEIARLAERGRIVCVHFRNVRGQLPRFTEVFLDEGDIDMGRAMQTYFDHGFEGPFMMDHTPRIQGDEGSRAGTAYAIGYIRSLLQQTQRRG